MKLGTHNSMSYLPVKKWYLAPFKFMAKCQSLPLYEQYNKGVRMFDIRVSFNKDNQPIFKHGIMEFEGDVYNVLSYLNSFKDTIYIRTILEENKYDYHKEELFIEFCEVIEKTFKNLKFFAGNRKYDWMVLYRFKTKDPNIEQPISSMNGSKLNSLWPWLYAKLHNKKSYNKAKKNKWILMDFIEIK